MIIAAPISTKPAEMQRAAAILNTQYVWLHLIDPTLTNGSVLLRVVRKSLLTEFLFPLALGTAIGPNTETGRIRGAAASNSTTDAHFQPAAHGGRILTPPP
jgi:hypothetical protein